jgi:hypothetical protein
MGLIWCTCLHAQYQQCPLFHDVHRKNAEEFDRAKDTVIAVAQWLIDTPMNWDVVSRSQANAFVLDWICLHPTYTHGVKTTCFPAVNENSDVLSCFIAISLYYDLTHPQVLPNEKNLFTLEKLAHFCGTSATLRQLPASKKWMRVVKHGTEKRYLKRCGCWEKKEKKA